MHSHVWDNMYVTIMSVCVREGVRLRQSCLCTRGCARMCVSVFVYVHLNLCMCVSECVHVCLCESVSVCVCVRICVSVPTTMSSGAIAGWIMNSKRPSSMSNR